MSEDDENLLASTKTSINFQRTISSECVKRFGQIYNKKHQPDFLIGVGPYQYVFKQMDKYLPPSFPILTTLVWTDSFLGKEGLRLYLIVKIFSFELYSAFLIVCPFEGNSWLFLLRLFYIYLEKVKIKMCDFHYLQIIKK